MAGQVLQGSLQAVTINGNRVQCEIDATLNVTTNTTETDPCKPLSTDAYKAARWVDTSVDSKAWTIDFSAKAFADAVEINNLDILDLLVNGDNVVQVEFNTTQTTDYDFDEVATFSGEGILSDFSWNNPSAGESTYDVTITGKGAPTFTRTPITT